MNGRQDEEGDGWEESAGIFSQVVCLCECV